MRKFDRAFVRPLSGDRGQLVLQSGSGEQVYVELSASQQVQLAGALCVAELMSPAPLAPETKPKSRRKT